jgi:outer membrane immunogenic protein
MNKRLFAAAAILGLFAASGVKAADMPLPMKAPPPPPAPIFSWTSFYIGGNGGGGSFWDGFSLTQTSAAGPAGTSGNFQGVGGLAGGQVGFNYEFFPSHVVIGVEGDGDWASIGGANTGCSTFTGGVFVGTTAGCATNNVTLNNFETVRGRLGYAFDTSSTFAPSVLVYATGGWAWGNSSGNSTVTCLGPFCPGLTIPFTGGTASFRDSENGWTAGGGMEWAFAQHWSARIEYLHLQFNNVNTNYTLTTTSILGTIPVSTHISSNNSVNVVRFGINYLFNFGGLAYAGGY